MRRKEQVDLANLFFSPPVPPPSPPSPDEMTNLNLTSETDMDTLILPPLKHR